ncbi:AMP-binding protein, partial [Pseudomonas aeruginosa]
PLYQADALEDCAARAEDIACFQLSGGTTGTPKLIPRRHREYLYNVRASAEVCGFDEHTVYLTGLPMAHNFTLCCPGVIG